jgi:hypothetical protein
LKIEEQVGDLEQPFGFNLWIDDAINGVLTRHNIALSEDRLPEIPQTPNLSFDKPTVDKHQRLRLRRSVAALRNASSELQRDNPKHADLLQVIEQYIVYNDRFSSEFDDDSELAARRLLAAIRLKDISEPGRVTSLLAAGRSRHEGSHPRDHRWLVSTPKIVRWPRATA